MKKPAATLTPFIYADTEDNSEDLLARGKSGFDKQVTQIAALTSDDSDRFYSDGDVDKFLAWLAGRPERVIYHHNAQYDIGNYFGNDFGRGLMFKMVGSRFIMARGFGKTWLDSFNIWPMALKKVGEAFGLEKLETASRARDKKYIWRDCEIGRAAMLFADNFAQRMNLQRMPVTLGGFAVNTFHCMGLSNCHDANLFARAALYGGRVELFATGGMGDLAYTDVNSLYPWAMLGEFPTDAQPMNKKITGWGVAHATVFVPDCFVAPLPVRRPDNSIFFPCGRFSGVWTFAELHAAEAHGAKILTIHRSYGSKKADDFYAPFIRRMFAERLKAKTDPEKLMLKLLMNNLYGRLAIRGEIVGNEKGTTRLKAIQIPLPEYTNYLHAAHVTSYGRLALNDFLRRVPEKDLIYCDTDSVIFHRRGRLPFSIGDKLGQMKLVARGRECATFAPKTYTFDDLTKAKGVPQKYAAQFIEKGVATFAQPFKMREVCEFTQRQTGQKKVLSVWRKVTKQRRSGYDKKDLQNGRFFPIVLPVNRPRHDDAAKTKTKRKGHKKNELRNNQRRREKICRNR